VLGDTVFVALAVGAGIETGPVLAYTTPSREKVSGRRRHAGFPRARALAVVTEVQKTVAVDVTTGLVGSDAEELAIAVAEDLGATQESAGASFVRVGVRIDVTVHVPIDISVGVGVDVAIRVGVDVGVPIRRRFSTLQPVRLVAWVATTFGFLAIFPASSVVGAGDAFTGLRRWTLLEHPLAGCDGYAEAGRQREHM